jgi:uncharacterized GH25 family protein
MRKEGLGRRLLTLTLGLLLAALMLVKPAWAELPTVEVPTVRENLVYSPSPDGVVILDKASFAANAQWEPEPWKNQWALVSRDGTYRVVIKTDPTEKLVVNDEGQLTSTAAGEYALEFELVKGDTPPFPDLYQWSDGSTTNKSANVTVAPLPVETLPSVPTEDITFDGNAHTVLNGATFQSMDLFSGAPYARTSATKDGIFKVTIDSSPYSLSTDGELQATAVGSYTIEVAIANSNYTWPEGTTLTDDKLVLTAQIVAAKIDKPTANTLTYTGGEQNLVPTGDHYTLTNNMGTNAGTYTVTATPDEGYAWSDGTTGAAEIEATIAPATVAQPTPQTAEYDGAAHVVLDVELASWKQSDPSNYSGTSPNGSIIVSASNEVASKLTLNSEGKLEATEVGEYSFTIDPGYDQNIPPYQTRVYNYAWSGAEAGKETEQITVTSSITAAKVAVPTAAAESFTYSGSEQTLVADGEHYTLTDITPTDGVAKARIDENGNAVATYANTYTVTVTPDSNYAWANAGEGKETEPVTIEVTIARAAATKPEAQTAEYNGKYQIVLDVPLTSWEQSGPSTISGTSTDGSIIVSASTEVASKLTYDPESKKLTARDLGTYALSVAPSNIGVGPHTTIYNYAWSGEEGGKEIETIQLESVITPAKLKKPETPVTVGYTGQPQVVLDIALERWELIPPVGKYQGVSSDGRYVVTASADEGAKLTLTDGKLTATNSGAYVFSVEPKPEYAGGPTNPIYNYVWEDGTVDPVQVTYTISSYRFVEKPTAGSFTYNGSEQTLAEVAAGAGYKLSGQTKGTNAGTYTVTATLENGYAWKPEEGGTESTDAYEFTVTIAQADLASAQVAEIAEQTETGSDIEPAVSVTFNGAAVPASEYTVSYSNNVNPGTATATITATDGGNFKGKTSTSFTIKANPTKTDYNVTIAATTNVYRVYNPNSGEHHYTTNKGEYDNLVAVGWNGEGVAWQSVEGGTPVYRVYNPNAGEHHYTASAAERDALVAVGWNDEGVAFNAASATSGTPVYRVYNPNQFSCNHHWTTSKVEYDHLVSIGWNDEGIAFYV